MKRSKILTLLLATSLGAGTVATVIPAQNSYAQSVNKILESNSEKDSDDTDNIDLDENDTKTTVEESREKAVTTIDTSEFNKQESYRGESEEEVTQKVNPKSSSFIAVKVPENYYDLNIQGAEKHVYGTSGQGRPLYYYKIGTGSKVLFMNFGIHGYEDAWSKDGRELTKLAKNLAERISSDNSANGLNGWSVVIIPSSNPDGVIDGWTNNGPGRNQVSKKIDLNRSFPTFFKAQYNDRNYTGSEPLLAPEAKALANLVDQFSNNSSHMSLVDVHGWLNETIGDPSLGKAFDSNFGISNKLMSKAASGYLISYAHSKGALATLLELPMPKSSEAIQSNGYANKIYNSVNSIIKNGDGFETLKAEGEVYNTSSLNIRITTSTNSNIIGTYKGGTKISILGKVGDWYQVKSGDGYGYVYKDYIKILTSNTGNSNSNNSGAIEAPAEYKVGKAYNLTTELNIRKSANTSSQVITRIKNGTEVKIISLQGNWYKIYIDSVGYGYAYKDYIEVINNDNNNEAKPETPSAPEAPIITNTGKVINVSTKLNIRGGAGTNFNIVGTLGANATVNIIAKEGTWYKISYNGIIGYVSGEYISINSNNSNNTAEKYGKVSNISTKLNIRKTASTSSGIVGTLSNNTKVTILEKINGWYKISYNGTIGYVSSSYLTEL